MKRNSSDQYNTVRFSINTANHLHWAIVFKGIAVEGKTTNKENYRARRLG